MSKLKISAILPITANADFESVRRTLDSFAQQDATPRELICVLYEKRADSLAKFTQRYVERKSTPTAEIICFDKAKTIKAEAIRDAILASTGFFFTLWSSGEIYHRNTLTTMRSALVAAGVSGVVEGFATAGLTKMQWLGMPSEPTDPSSILAAAKRQRLTVAQITILGEAVA